MPGPRFLTDAANSDTVRISVANKRDQIQPPAQFSDCPKTSDSQYEAPEPIQEGFPTPGAALTENLSPLPVASYSIAVTESTDRSVRWEIMMTGAPWGLTIGNKTAIYDSRRPTSP